MQQRAQRKRLGEILIEQRVLTPRIVDRIIRISNTTRRRFGETLEETGLVTGEELAAALAEQFGYKIVLDLGKYTFPRELLRLVPMEMAFENRIFPLKATENTLALAMADPTDEDILRVLQSNLSLRVLPFISTHKEIMKAIARNYLGKTVEDRRKTVLITCSDEIERQMLKRPLLREHYHVIEAVDAKDGFREALLNTPGVIIAEKEMPRIDGFAYLTNLLNNPATRKIPVILMSRNSSAEEEAAAFHRGFFDYIHRPVKEITLVTRVRRALAAGWSYLPHMGSAFSIDLDEGYEGAQFEVTEGRSSAEP
ncbi:MAG TPA: response regulator [Verrucomicrobiae bacterium]|nr:response regulator [Verrucomicrobiae bacterium]